MTATAPLTSVGMSDTFATALRPEPAGPNTPAGPTVSVDPWDRLADVLGAVPGWIWAAALSALLAATLATLPLIRRQARKAGARSAGQTSGSDRKDRGLFAIALTVAISFWLAVLYGSASGLMAFGRDELHWTDGRDLLVPATLDGIAVAFGLLAFIAVRGGRNPDRSMTIAWGAMLASAAINFFHESGLPGGSPLGGGYLALLSLLGMLIFHEFLAQFEDGADSIVRKRPKFGLRWITYTPNTLCAALAWINHPPADGTRATVPAAVAHLERVRAEKRARKATAGTPTVTVEADSSVTPGVPGTDTPTAGGTAAPAAPGTGAGTDTPAGSGTGRRTPPRTGSHRARTDTQLLTVLRDPRRVPREADGTVPIKRAAKVLGTGPDRARRLLGTAGLLARREGTNATSTAPVLPVPEPTVLTHANGNTPDLTDTPEESR